MVKQQNRPIDNNNGAAVSRELAAREAARLRRAAFTLAELLVVIAITTILLALLFGPIVQTFNLTRKARSISQAQDAARFGLQRLTRELSQATYVFDNTATPIVLPLEDSAGTKPREAAYAGRNFAYPGGDPTPTVLFGKIDFIPAATRKPGSGEIVDPTTGGKLGGSDLQFPLAPGTRVVRYFIGLRNPMMRQNGAIVTDAQGRPQLRYYANVYEFPRSDNTFNPFILYRAEFDPNDPNLFNLNNFDNIGENQGGFNDPNFFYNVYSLAANGKTYAENWFDISQPVLTSQNMDLLAWPKQGTRDYQAGSPFQPTVRFAPSTVVGDSATPGFLSNSGSEEPGAVPTVYSAKYGQWVLPFTVTFYRGATRNGSGTGANAGQLAITVFMKDTGNGVLNPAARVDSKSGTLSPGPDDTRWYYTFSPTTRKMVVKTPSLTYIVDPNRGRIETGIQPLAGNANGALLYINPNQQALNPMNPASVGPNFTDPVPTQFVLNTRDPQAGTNGIPTNQGILGADLYSANYSPVVAPVLGPLVSPMTVFGQSSASGFVGIQIVPGSERVFAPDVNFPESALSGGASLTHLNLVTYARVPWATGSIASPLVPLVQDKDDPTKTMYPYYSAGRLDYRLNTLFPANQAILQFDEPPTSPTTTDGVPGLPAKRVNDTSGAPEKILRVTYLWQNNYARNASGAPVDANNRTYAEVVNVSSPTASDAKFQPEADVVKVDYSTRSLMTVAIGARVYDTSSGRPTSVQADEKIEINNVGR